MLTGMDPASLLAQALVDGGYAQRVGPYLDIIDPLSRPFITQEFPNARPRI